MPSLAVQAARTWAATVYLATGIAVGTGAIVLTAPSTGWAYVAMTLGRAQAKLDDGDAAGAQDLLRGASEESKRAMAELRDLGCGILPRSWSTRARETSRPPTPPRAPSWRARPGTSPPGASAGLASAWPRAQET